MTVRNWAGNVTFGARELHRPTSIEALQQLVADAPRIHALGTGHSFNRIADTDGDLVTVADIATPITIDPDAQTVRVGGGTRFGELAVALDEQGWALPNLGSLPHISVAGACATGTHGSGDANRCLAAGAVGVEFVRADGELVTRTADDPDFAGSVLALGALGVVTALTLRVVPSFELRQDVWLDAPMASVLGNVDAIMSAGYSVSMFTDLSRSDVMDAIWVKTRSDGALADGRDWGARPATVPQNPIKGADPSAATDQLGSYGPWHARLPHFRAEFTPSAGHEQQSEYLIRRSDGAAAIAAVSELPVQQAVQVSEIRTVAADELWLSPCQGRDTLAVHFTWVDDDALVQPAVKAVEAALAPFDPRPHWGKVFGDAFRHVELARHYPRLDEFRALATEHDPSRCFSNTFLTELIY
ncbi:MAG TPA: FAD-binding protein [Jatrophihabitans sp.]